MQIWYNTLASEIASLKEGLPMYSYFGLAIVTCVMSQKDTSWYWKLYSDPDSNSSTDYFVIQQTIYVGMSSLLLKQECKFQRLTKYHGG